MLSLRASEQVMPMRGGPGVLRIKDDVPGAVKTADVLEVTLVSGKGRGGDEILRASMCIGMDRRLSQQSCSR